MRNLLPHFIAEQYHQGNLQGRFDAVVLFVDVSGFTRLTETLMQHGNEGAEVLSSTLNSLFQPMVAAVYERGGFISNFAGDALTAIYPPSYDQRLDTAYALRSAQSIQRFFAKHGVQQTRFGVFEFAVKIGLSVGKIDWGIIGTRDHAFFFRGAAISSASRAENHTGPGQIVLDENILQLINYDKIEVEQTGDGHARLLKVIAGGEQAPSAKRSPLRKATAAKFLPQAVIDFKGGGEFRDVASVFIGFEGDADLDDLHRFVSNVLDSAREFSAYIKEVDFTDNGVIPCYFGAPVAFENNIERALDFMLAVQKEAAEIPSLRLRCGITYGRAFTGIVGGSERSQYSVIGTTVNIAARLMTEAASGKIYVAERVAQQQGYRFEHIADIAYKNIAQATPTYMLVGTEQQSQNFFAEQMIGRTAELRMLKNFASPIFDGEFAGIAYIYGEPGVGKSHLAYGVQQVLTSKHDTTWLIALCDPILRKPFNPFVSMLNRYFDQSSERSAEKDKEVFDRTLDDLIDRVEASNSLPTSIDEIVKELRRTRSILGALLGLRWDDSLYEQLDAKGRYENTLFALKTFVQAESLLHPVVMQIEDAHWIDNDSAVLLKALVRRLESYPIMLLATSRYNDDGTMLRIELENVLEIDLHLKTFTTDELRSFADAQLGGSISDALLAKLQERAMANPFFAGQMLAYFQERELLHIVDGVWQLKAGAATDVALPETVSAMLIARIDRLSGRVKEVVKAAAVIGMEFDVALLTSVFRSEVVPEVKAAEQRRIWGEMRELRYLFKHALLRDAAYEMQMHTRLRELHHLTAEALIVVHGEKPEEYYADIAHHFEKAEAIDRAIEYLEKAGNHAKDRYRNREAIELYDRLVGYLDGNHEHFGLRIDILMKIGEVLQLIGEWGRAAALHTEIVVAAERAGDRQRVADARLWRGQFNRLQGEYDDAIKDLTEALRICEELGDRRGISKAIGSIGIVYKERGEYERAIECYQQQVAICEELGDRHGISNGMGNRGIVHYYRGEYARALECYQQQFAMCEERGDRRGISIAVGNMGLIYVDRGEYERALECYRQMLAIGEELGDRRGISLAIGNMGLVFWGRGEYERTLECYQQMLAIGEDLSDRRGISFAIGNMGTVYYARGEFDLALECFEQQRVIAEELGDRPGISVSLGNIGLVYADRGEYDRALECHKQKLAISNELGDRRGISLAIGNMGLVYKERGEYDRALECFDQGAEGYRAIGFRDGLTEWLAGTAYVLLELAATGDEMPEYLPAYVPGATPRTWQAISLERAREHAEECVAISRELPRPDTLFIGSILLAGISAAEGRQEQALKRLAEMLEQSDNDEQRAELHYWLWKTSPPSPLSVDGEGGQEGRGQEGRGQEEMGQEGRGQEGRGQEGRRQEGWGQVGMGQGMKYDAGSSLPPLFARREGPGGTPRSGLRSHRLEAFRLYEQLFAKTPKHEYRKRIEELK